ncbi:tripartite ATP-independent transporter DctP family solute receptor [Lewinella marina]|uniref:TRAP transporter substrate-binding protein DctP n=1 Tax=Neolewinella marina TaxID=438751 RepID=A0A2G0CIZ7_9BACT|nr:TRAP transporter substrate-binding protein [Neolewinella marina]NJB84919.1 tripartite ATP-independent transporter DctP family solute receptor [Neolewinella marina]PHK99928.1 TRAP transporter substrate-binding protein DctP [Neolewinella marina]
MITPLRVLPALLLLLLTGCGEEGQTRVLRLAHGLDTGHPVHLGMEFMAERLAEKSNGELTIAIYPNQQLGTERQALELLQIGSLAMTKVSAAVLENFSPEATVLSLPYLFRDREHVYQFQDSELGREVLTTSEQFRLRGLVYFDAGQRSFYTKDRPVHTPDDLKGTKIRVQLSATAINLVKALGGSPTPISYGELYTALQQGVVDGAENNPPSFYTSRHYEVCKYYTLDEHTATPDVLIIGTGAWERLTPQQREWLQEAADEAVVYQREVWQEAELEALEAVEAAGVEIIRPDKGPFIEQTAPILESYRDQPAIYSLIERIIAMAPENEG